MQGANPLLPASTLIIKGIKGGKERPKITLYKAQYGVNGNALGDKLGGQGGEYKGFRLFGE